jgi:hypothetical protein
MHGPINVKTPNNTSKWQMGFNSAFKGLILKYPIKVLWPLQRQKRSPKIVELLQEITANLYRKQGLAWSPTRRN